MEYRRGRHSLYDFKYHLVWCPKYRYRVLTGQVGERARALIREIGAANYVDILSGSISPDQGHLLCSIPPQLSVSALMKYLKGKSSRKLQMEFPELKKRYWGQHCWARGYFGVRVGNVNEEDIQRYLEEQEQHHKQDNFQISTY